MGVDDDVYDDIDNIVFAVRIVVVVGYHRISSA